MKVKLLKTGDICEVNDSYGTRLIEQGQAVIDNTPAPKPVKKIEPATKKPEITKARKGE